MPRSIPFNPEALPLEERIAWLAARAAKHQLQAQKYPNSEAVLRRANPPRKVYPVSEEDYYISHHRTEVDEDGNETKTPVYKVKPLRNPLREATNRNAPRHIKKTARKARTRDRVQSKAA